MDPVSTIQLVASTAALSKNISQWASEWVSESHRSLVRRVYGASSQESVYGLDVVNDSEDVREHDVDICFVHGLRGDLRLTWKLGGDDDYGFWPKELLAQDARIGRARVLTYGYDSDFPSFEYLTERTLYHQAQELLNELCRVRQKDGRRRLIFVCHTLGGILVQSALVIALASKDEALKRIQSSVRGLIFLNTPYSRRLMDEEWSRAFRHLVHDADPDMEDSNLSSKKLKIMLEPFSVASSDIQIKELTAFD